MAAPRKKWHLGSLTSDQTHTPWSGSAESKSLDYQGSKNIHQTTEYPHKHQGSHVKLSRCPVKITITRFDLWDKPPPHHVSKSLEILFSPFQDHFDALTIVRGVRVPQQFLSHFVFRGGGQFCMAASLTSHFRYPISAVLDS